mmetsp:Transcript_40953/g.78212  ORF Transcript_40953/g.78212 Transcript_40953/m.78212 type:complete len:259 (-) Transcript_40953:645-1421(-)
MDRACQGQDEGLQGGAEDKLEGAGGRCGVRSFAAPGPVRVPSRLCHHLLLQDVWVPHGAGCAHHANGEHRGSQQGVLGRRVGEDCLLRLGLPHPAVPALLQARGRHGAVSGHRCAEARLQDVREAGRRGGGAEARARADGVRVRHHVLPPPQQRGAHAQDLRQAPHAQPARGARRRGQLHRAARQRGPPRVRPGAAGVGSGGLPHSHGHVLQPGGGVLQPPPAQRRDRAAGRVQGVVRGRQRVDLCAEGGQHRFVGSK